MNKYLQQKKAYLNSVSTEEVVALKPYPLNTINFQKLGSTKLGVNVDSLMSIAEKLYTKGLISYPRTETTTYYPLISPKMLLNKLAYCLKDSPEKT